MKSYSVRLWVWVVGGLLMAGAAQAANPTNFTVKAVGADKSFTLTSAKGQYVALHFLLKTECPICLKYTREYVANVDQLPGVTHVFLKPDAEADIAQWTGKLGGAGSRVTVYRDPEASLAKQYGIPDGYQFHGQVVHYPALVLLDPSGTEVFRYVGKNNTDRYSFEQLTTKIKELRAGAP